MLDFDSRCYCRSQDKLPRCALKGIGGSIGYKWHMEDTLLMNVLACKKIFGRKIAVHIPFGITIDRTIENGRFPNDTHLQF
jgi:hypothetical protein